MKFWLFVGIGLSAVVQALGQERTVEGIVYDKSTNERIARVNIQNLRTKQSIYNTLKADFKLTALSNDLLIVSKPGYFNDTLKIPANNTLIIYMRPTAIQLKQVNVRDTLLTPQKKYMALRSEYSKAYGSNAYRDPLSVSPGSGAGISIDAIWNSLSREGRNAQRLQGVIERDYHESVIDFRFNKSFVASITGLKDPQLTDFMYKYRPGYYTVVNDNEYEFISKIRTNAKRYLRNPRVFALPPPLRTEDGSPVKLN